MNICQGLSLDVTCPPVGILLQLVPIQFDSKRLVLKQIIFASDDLQQYPLPGCAESRLPGQAEEDCLLKVIVWKHRSIYCAMKI